MPASRGAVGFRHRLPAAICLLAFVACGGSVRTDGGQRAAGAAGAGGFGSGNQPGKGPPGGFAGGKDPVTCAGSWCGDTCADLSKNPNNCGTCFSKCPRNFLCIAGSCQDPCAPNETYCTGMELCVDLQSNPLACGSCESPCANGWACVGGKCDSGTCASGVSCAGPNGSSFCIDPTSDTANCGACGNRCDPAEWCAMGKCLRPDCSGVTYCPNTGCADTASDWQNCGGCDKPCSPGSLFNPPAYACTSGSCGCAVSARPCGSGCATDFWYCPPPDFQGSKLDLCSQSARNAYEQCACTNCLASTEACSASTSCMTAMDCGLQNLCPGCQSSFMPCTDPSGQADPAADKLAACLNLHCPPP